ncbi:hypothetical protein BN996_00843 [Haloferax massiliensis]|uniref:Uncharacterized protein n=1 Tax=Haloferax massiliensis TaxID=1476858 RepID=A0A0D6JNA4_9EURY|nr:hypothetical protein BN996_00843 [Haloferax massiliensis]
MKMRPSGSTRGRVHNPSPPMPLLTRGTDPESPDEYDDARRVALALRLVKLALGVVASALTVAKLLGAL